ncbi:apolipoprotein N-acyltransferase [Pseudodesulfovibrio sp. zrk46]|uniref:apolipoprotein N-acyltransferase n=1 Tax=Pseudodesulfovibrio sp. zrk46 TaxID=2725288 RepID=UPI001449FD99|nr:apolipoprotein N-acyltransferase [Pseudodesulfovibrio sp. zrk46]QJB57667.1 apolipoprotein N-acyltransferase [Pseudodesulfovibrio sp. zrk46]
MFSLVLVGTLGAWLGFANPVLQFPLAALAFPLALTWIGLRAISLKQAFKFGWFAGLLAGIGCYYWMVIPVQTYGGLPWFIALPCPVVLAAAMGIYYGLFSVAMYQAGQKLEGIPLCLLAGLTWASLEMLMGWLFSGFPWTNLASAFAPWPFAIQGAALLGAYGLSGVLTMLAVAALLFSTYRSTLYLSISLSIGICAFGVLRISHFNGPKASYPISIIQGNIDQGAKWDPEYQAATVKKYATLTLQAISHFHPKVVIWPETAMPFYFQDKTPYKKAVQILAKDSRTPIITGSPAYKVIDAKARKYVLYNRAWLVDDTGRALQRYDKEHLVPFGEYMPFEEWIPFKKLVQAAGDFVPGDNNQPIIIDGVALGMLICYEGIFPELAQQQVERGASVILNISNDAWFGETSAPNQHLNLTILRAVEQGRWLVRSTNTGISAFVDPLGRITAMSTQFKAEHLNAFVAPINDTTPFHRNYDLIARSIYALTVAMYGLFVFGARRKEQ